MSKVTIIIEVEDVDGMKHVVSYVRTGPNSNALGRVLETVEDHLHSDHGFAPQQRGGITW